MRLWIDTEFNDFKGHLISMALVSDADHEWYEVLHCPRPSPWVAKNVIPHLGKQPILIEDMQLRLAVFLNQFSSIHIVADWPEDIQYFCSTLIIDPGKRIATPPLTMEVRRDIDCALSAVPHNALEDARALRIAGQG